MGVHTHLCSVQESQPPTEVGGVTYWPADVQYVGGSMDEALCLGRVVHGGQVVLTQPAWLRLQGRLPPSALVGLVLSCLLCVTRLHAMARSLSTTTFHCQLLSQSFSLGVYEVPGYYSPGRDALDITQADSLHRGLLIQLLPQVLAMRTFPPLPCAQLTKGFFDAPDPMHDVAICFVKVRVQKRVFVCACECLPTPP